MKKFFIHIPKNGGMTIRWPSLNNGPLSKHVQIATKDTHISKEYTNAVTETMRKTKDHPGYEHARWRDISSKFKDNMECFAIVRNPWERVVSRYWFARKTMFVEKKNPTDYADVSSFEAFLEERHKWGNKPYMWHRAIRNWYPAYEHVCDDEGNVRCDILRLDHLNEDVCDYLGIDKMTGPRNVTAVYEDKSTSHGTSSKYMEMYNDTTRQIIADWYAKDIDYWGFDFDTGATRNYWNIK